MNETLRDVIREQNMIRREAKAVWLAEARKIANPYTDRLSLRLVGNQAIAALEWESPLTVLAAIRSRMTRTGSPRFIPEWAREHGSAQRELQNLERKMRDREDEERIVVHEGTRYLGHVPSVVGSRCEICGKGLQAHKTLADRSFRPVGVIAERVLAAQKEAASPKT